MLLPFLSSYKLNFTLALVTVPVLWLVNNIPSVVVGPNIPSVVVGPNIPSVVVGQLQVSGLACNKIFLIHKPHVNI